MGVKSQFCSNIHQIRWEGASLQAIKESFNFLTLSPPFDPPRRVQGRHVGVKPYLVSDLHQIWCEVTFLQAIKGAFIF